MKPLRPFLICLSKHNGSKSNFLRNCIFTDVTFLSAVITTELREIKPILYLFFFLHYKAAVTIKYVL